MADGTVLNSTYRDVGYCMREHPGTKSTGSIDFIKLYENTKTSFNWMYLYFAAVLIYVAHELEWFEYSYVRTSDTLESVSSSAKAHVRQIILELQ